MIKNSINTVSRSAKWESSEFFVYSKYRFWCHSRILRSNFFLKIWTYVYGLVPYTSWIRIFRFCSLHQIYLEKIWFRQQFWPLLHVRKRVDDKCCLPNVHSVSLQIVIMMARQQRSLSSFSLNIKGSAALSQFIHFHFYFLFLGHSFLPFCLLLLIFIHLSLP